MRFKLTNDFIDGESVRHKAGSILEFDDNDPNVAPALSWQPLDAAAQEALERQRAFKQRMAGRPIAKREPEFPIVPEVTASNKKSARTKREMTDHEVDRAMTLGQVIQD